MIEEGYSQDQAVAIANDMCDKKCKIMKQEASEPHFLDDYDTRRKYWKLKINKEEENEKKFLKKLRSYLNRQKNDVLENIRDERSWKTKDALDDSFNLEVEAKIAEDEFIPLLTQFLEEAGEDTIGMSGGDQDFNLDSEITRTLNKRAELFSKSINETTFNQLKTQFQESIEAGEGRKELVKRIEDTYDGILDEKKGRAMTIARTETGVAMMTGTFEGYKQSGVKHKVWTAVMDPRTRDTHQSLDGDKVPIDQPFSNGLMHPRDPDGPVSEVANCRCVI